MRDRTKIGVKGVSAGVWKKPQRHEAMWKKRGKEVSVFSMAGCVDGWRRNRTVWSPEC